MRRPRRKEERERETKEKKSPPSNVVTSGADTLKFPNSKRYENNKQKLERGKGH